MNAVPSAVHISFCSHFITVSNKMAYQYHKLTMKIMCKNNTITHCLKLNVVTRRHIFLLLHPKISN